MKINCIYCNNNLFDEQAYFKGTTEHYKQDRFCYAHCTNCKSFINTSLQAIDYTNYITGNTISLLKLNRFVKFLKQISLKGEVLDYGCGGGALVRALRTRGVTVDGYEPYNKDFTKIPSSKKYSLIYLTHVFEHLSNLEEFFKNLKACTTKESQVLTIHPSSSRIEKLKPNCPFQAYTIHAPFHLGIPSDEITIKLFQNHGFTLRRKISYDIQRSGFKDNSRVSALLMKYGGGVKENTVNVSFIMKLKALSKAPLSFFNALFINTKDRYVSTFLFERTD